MSRVDGGDWAILILVGLIVFGCASCRAIEAWEKVQTREICGGGDE